MSCFKSIICDAEDEISQGLNLDVIIPENAKPSPNLPVGFVRGGHSHLLVTLAIMQFSGFLEVVSSKAVHSTMMDPRLLKDS